MPKIFSFCNQKGGVGKTTTAVNLATYLALLGNRILLIDIDPQGNATSGMGIDKSNLEKTSYDLICSKTDSSQIILNSQVINLNVIPANSDLAGAEIEIIDEMGREFLLKQALKDLTQSYDFILIDCPPSLGLLTINAMAASDAIIIPLQCEYYALEGLGQLIETYQLVKEKLNPGLEIGGVILTMADFRTNLTQQVIEDVKNHFQETVFKTIVPRTVKISEAPSFGKPIALYDPNSKGAKCYEDIAKEFIKRFAKEQTNFKTMIEDRRITLASPNENVSDGTTQNASITTSETPQSQGEKHGA